MRTSARLTAIFLCVFLLAARAGAASLTVAWDASPDASVTGYRVLYGTASRTYTSSVDAGRVTQFRVDGLTDGQTYYVTVVSYNSGGELSDVANEVTSRVSAVSVPLMSIDSPIGGATVQGSFVLGGWALDAGAASGTGVDVLHVWAWPAAGGAAQWVGALATGGARPDVGAAFGAQFTPSGFTTQVSLKPGTWDLVAYAHSTVTGTFADARLVRITAVAPVSKTTIVIDTPRAGAVDGSFMFAGWAADLAVASGAPGPGVDAVHVWAYPAPGSGRAPIFAGSATLRGPRSDVGGVYGARFTESGYALIVDGLLVGFVPGTTYRLVAYARNTATGVFDASAFVDVTIR